MQSKAISWLLVGALLVGALLFWMLPRTGSVSEELELKAEAPWLIGSLEAPFAYSGAPGAQRIEGHASLRWKPDDVSLEIYATLPAVPEPLHSAAGDAETPTEGPRVLTIELLEQLESWSAVPIFGDTETGDARLPETPSTSGGTGSFRVQLADARRESVWFGLWAVADALRREDGAIRKQGLVFSPLLRDREGFSDPNRQELTLLLYEEEAFDARVILQLVFPEIGIPLGG